MLLRDLVVNIIVIISVLSTVNGFPQRETPLEENSLDAQVPNQIRPSLIKKIIELIGVQNENIFDPEQSNPKNELIVHQDSQDLNQQPKKRVKRFTCWHSCLGPWQQKNPRLKEMRHRISNVSPSGGGQGGPQSSPSGDEPEPPGEPEPEPPGIGEVGGPSEPEPPEREDKSGDVESETKEPGEAESEATTETPDEEAAADEAANNEASATEAAEDESAATEAPAEDGEEAATEASADEPPAPENEEDGKEEKKEDKRQIGSNEEFYYDEEFSAEGLSGGNIIDEDYVDTAAA